MLEIAVEHVKRVRSVVQGRLESNHASGLASHPQRESHLPNTGNRITQSWVRCLNEYKLDPDTYTEPEIVSPAELQDRQDRLANLQAVAKVEMANLYQQLAGPATRSSLPIEMVSCSTISAIRPSRMPHRKPA